MRCHKILFSVTYVFGIQNDHYNHCSFHHVFLALSHTYLYSPKQESIFQLQGVISLVLLNGSS